MGDAATEAAGRPGALRRVEFAGLYIAVPLAMAFVFPADWMWPALATVTGLGVLLLAATEEFSFRKLFRGRLVASWSAFAAFFALTTVIAFGLVLLLRPAMLLSLPTYAPAMWLTILALYPFLSVIPQELVYRALFFERYGALFPDRRVAIVVNALVFGLAHLFFWNWVAVTMTTAGGALFALAYLGRGGFLWATFLHAVAGQIIFTSGLGVFFYHGAVPAH